MEGRPGADCQETDGCEKAWADGSVGEEEVRRGACLHQVFIPWNSTALKERCTGLQRMGRLAKDLGQEQ